MTRKYFYTFAMIFTLIIVCNSHEKVLAESINSKAGITFSDSDVSPTTNPNKPDGSNEDKNIKSGILPKTGGESSNLFYNIGVLCLFVSVIMFVSVSRNYKDREHYGRNL